MIPARRAANSFWCGIEGQGNYHNNQRVNNALISPAIDLTTVYSATLEFYETYDTEGGYDYCMVDVSLDGESVWTPLRGTAFPGTGTAPSGSSGGWVLSTLDLSAFLGSTIRIRFYFDTLDSLFNNFPGWFVDDVTVVGKRAWLSPEILGGTVAPADSVKFQLKVRTEGIDSGLYRADLSVQSNDPIRPVENVPVELEVVGIRLGDLNADFNINAQDIIYMVNYVFRSGPEPAPGTADVNCDGGVTSSDIIFLVNFVFKSGPSPCS